MDTSQNYELLKLILGSTGILGLIITLIVLIFKIGKFSNRFDGLELSFMEVKKDLAEIKTEIYHIRDRVSRVEGQEDYARTAILELWKREKL